MTAVVDTAISVTGAGVGVLVVSAAVSVACWIALAVFFLKMTSPRRFNRAVDQALTVASRDAGPTGRHGGEREVAQ